MAERVQLACRVAGGGYFPGDLATFDLDEAKALADGGGWRAADVTRDGRELVAAGVDPDVASRAAILGAATPAELMALDTVNLHGDDRATIEVARASLPKAKAQPRDKRKPRTLTAEAPSK